MTPNKGERFSIPMRGARPLNRKRYGLVILFNVYKGCLYQSSLGNQYNASRRATRTMYTARKSERRLAANKINVFI